MSIENKAYIDAVLAKCASLKAARLWSPEPTVRPRAWLSNFSGSDKTAAAVLLDSFVFFSEEAKLRLLVGAFESASRVPARSTRALPPRFLTEAVFTPVRGEIPNLTDSGFTMSRMVRQHLGVAEDRFVELEGAYDQAVRGRPVVFIDDVTISGDQFMRTWNRPIRTSDSFADLCRTQTVHAACVYIVATADARDRIERDAKPVIVHATHFADDTHQYQSIPLRQPPPPVPDAFAMVESLLTKYAPLLTFRAEDDYMLEEPSWALAGYKERGLMFALENNVPDGSLPLFWADGPSQTWTPLVKRA